MKTLIFGVVAMMMAAGAAHAGIVYPGASGTSGAALLNQPLMGGDTNVWTGHGIDYLGGKPGVIEGFGSYSLINSDPIVPVFTQRIYSSQTAFLTGIAPLYLVDLTLLFIDRNLGQMPSNENRWLEHVLLTPATPDDDPILTGSFWMDVIGSGVSATWAWVTNNSTTTPYGSAYFRNNIGETGRYTDYLGYTTGTVAYNVSENPIPAPGCALAPLGGLLLSRRRRRH
jgi:hypothetical protein